MGQAKNRKAEIDALKAAGPKASAFEAALEFIMHKQQAANPTPMNSYTISVDIAPKALKEWLINKRSPIAASTVQPGTDYASTFVLTGNASALSVLARFAMDNKRFTWVANGNSEPLHLIDADYGTTRYA